MSVARELAVNDWQGRLTVALRSFWRIRERQAAKSKGRDRGSRGAVTGGAQLDGFIKLFREVLLKLLREGLYDAACLILSDREGGLKGRYQEPSEELTFSRFAASLIGRAATYAALRGSSAHA